MDQDTMVVGLDVHKGNIEAAILPPTAARPTERMTIEYHPSPIERLVRRVMRYGQNVVFIYEAGPCGYEVHRQLTDLGRRCAGSLLR